MLRRMGRPGLLGMAARTAVVAGTATAVSGRVAARQQDRADQAAEAQAWEAQQQAAAMQAAAAQAVAAAPPPTVPPAPAQPPADRVSQLTQLATLHSQGALTDEEFAAAKASLLG